MNRRWILPPAIILAATFALPISAQEIPWGVENRRSQEFVRRLKSLIRRAERDRSADRSLIHRLRVLASQFDWPWRFELLDENFKDPAYRINRGWKVGGGSFDLERGVGLRTTASPAKSVTGGTSSGETGGEVGELLGNLLAEALTQKLREKLRLKDSDAAAASAEMYMPLKVNNAFAARIQLTSRGSRDRRGGLEIGFYAGRNRGDGYRLIYFSNNNPSLEMVRIRRGRSAVIEVYERGLNMEDRRPHTLEWFRGLDGSMAVLLDGREIHRTVDRGIRDDFNGIAVANRGGDYTLHRITLLGAK